MVTRKGDCDTKATAAWRRGFAPGQTIQRVRPRESFAYLGNPHKGTTTFQRFNGDKLYGGERWDDRGAPTEFKPFDGNVRNEGYPQTTMAYLRWLWRVIEPEKGAFRWEIIDGALEAARVRGQTLQVRLMPYAQDDLPEWFWGTGAARVAKKTTYGLREPDVNDPLFIKHWCDLIRAFGKRYDGHPDLESFDVAYGGPWGEMGGNSNKATAKKVVDGYLRSFKETQLVSMLGTHGCAYAARKTARRIGWRGDCFGDLRTEGRGQVPEGLCWNHMHDAYPREVVEDGVAEAWRAAPVTLETCWTVGHWHKQGWDVDWILDQGYRYHISVFMPKSCAIPEEWAEKMAEFDRRMGYRFVLRQMILPLEVKPGQRFEAPVWIDNVGCAPIYRRYRFAYRFRQAGREEVIHSKQDIRKWMPGHSWFKERVAAPGWLRPGSAKVDVGIVEEGEGASGRRQAPAEQDVLRQQATEATKAVRVKLAIEPVREDGWHPMGLVDVV